MKIIVKFENVTKLYGTGENEVKALDNVSFEIYEGEFVVILGPSGAGKSTLLNLLGGMDKASSGTIMVNGKQIERYNDNELTQFRAENIGFVFQFYNLIPTLTAYENVALIKEVAPNYQDANTVLDKIGLGPHKKKLPSQLSGGEQQRVSIARALAKNPVLMLCDEPTGALDSVTGVNVLTLLQEMSREGKTVIVVTHNAVLKEAADRVIKIKNGKVDEINQNSSPIAVSEVVW